MRGAPYFPDTANQLKCFVLPWRNQRDAATLSSLPACHLFGCAVLHAPLTRPINFVGTRPNTQKSEECGGGGEKDRCVVHSQQSRPPPPRKTHAAVGLPVGPHCAAASSRQGPPVTALLSDQRPSGESPSEGESAAAVWGVMARVQQLCGGSWRPCRLRCRSFRARPSEVASAPWPPLARPKTC